MHRLLPLFALLLLAACEGGAPPPGPPSPAAQLRVGFGGVVDTITVDAVERLPLRAAELVAPDGAATPASYINVVDSPSIATGQQAVTGLWHDSLTGGAAPSFVAPKIEGAAALRSSQQLLAVASTADIILPDRVAYRRDWQHYRIRLTFGTPPREVETQEVPAPQPPPE